MKTPVPESLFNKVIGVYPATSVKERTPIMGFFDEFCEILKTSFFQATASILRKKYYTNKIVKKSLRKEKNGNSL